MLVIAIQGHYFMVSQPIHMLLKTARVGLALHIHAKKNFGKKKV